MTTRQGPCADWTTEDEVLATRVLCNLDPPDPTQMAAAIAVASRWLYLRTGRKFTGTCTSTTLVARACSGCIPLGRPWDPGVRYDEVGDWPCARHTGSAISLGYQPIIAVTSIVNAAAEAIDATYVIEDRRWLVRTDRGVWPLPLTVTFTHGSPPPVDLRMAATLLAAELLLAGTPGQTCRLPKRTQSVVRNGVAMAWVDTQDAFDKGKTGVEEIDLMLVNYPWPIRRRSRIFSGDTPSAIHRRG